MTVTKKRETIGKSVIEYPVFEKEEGEDSALAELFSSRLRTSAVAALNDYPDHRINLTFSVQEDDGEIRLNFLLSYRRAQGARRTKKLTVIFEDGFIKKFEEN